MQVLDPKTVHHVKCGKSLQMKSLFNTHNFHSHVGQCTGSSKSKRLSGAGTSTIDTFFQPVVTGSQRIQMPSASNSDPAKSKALPCPGLTEEVYPQISGYLNRTGAQGGGAPSITTISLQLYGKKFSHLSSTQKTQVRLAQSNEWNWENHLEEGHIFSTECTGQAIIGCNVDDVSACVHCHALLGHKGFKNALRVPMPPDKHYKYLNYAYRNKTLANLYFQCVDLWPLMEDNVSMILIESFMSV